LLCRLYDPTGGTITIDGQNIKDVNLHSLREHIGVVPQDVVLFNDTILHNIRYGRTDATFEEVTAAAKSAQIHDTITSLPNGYDTLVGERGAKLSGGERQRIGIARCILKKATIVVFDEATSALDSGTEHKVLEAVRELSSHKTSLVIAHGLSSIMDAQQIIVLRNESVAERGTHDELIRIPNGVYAQMWSRQVASLSRQSASGDR